MDQRKLYYVISTGGQFTISGAFMDHLMKEYNCYAFSTEEYIQNI